MKIKGFIEITLKNNGNKKSTINVRHIVTFSAATEGCFIDLINENIRCSESYEELKKLINLSN